MLGIQTDRQRDLMKQHGNKILVVDETHGTNQYRYQLLTCLVVDDNRRGWPVSHLITSKSDADTLKYFFQAMREATPDFNISCVITDDDPALVNSMTEGFDSDFRHILCKWHILKNWKENLRHKVPKEFVPTMLEELKEIMNAVELDKFDHLCKGFFKKYEDNCRTSSFMKYFHQHYMPRCTKWAMCHRNFPHASVNTTGHIESFHSRLKRFYLKRKVNKRLDDLIDILLKLECDDHSTRAREASKGFSLLQKYYLFIRGLT
uniref:MULE transposase domain-containing protein n=1 Tax=Cacopsylla melanoneura TaxID=428564 RepID=A0A8D9ARJ8_9HEMI